MQAEFQRGFVYDGVESVLRRLNVFYQIPSTTCIPRLTAAMATQQQNPIRMGLPPVFTSLTTLVFKPMAAMAIMMKNLLCCLKGLKKEASTPRETQKVVTTEASRKNKIKREKSAEGGRCFSLPPRPALLG